MTNVVNLPDGWLRRQIDKSSAKVARMSRAEKMEDALRKIATVIGEDDPQILWPWAQELAQQALNE